MENTAYFIFLLFVFFLHRPSDFASKKHIIFPYGKYGLPLRIAHTMENKNFYIMRNHILSFTGKLISQFYFPLVHHYHLPAEEITNIKKLKQQRILISSLCFSCYFVMNRNNPSCKRNNFL